MACNSPWLGSFLLRLVHSCLPAWIIFVVKTERRRKRVLRLTPEYFPAGLIAVASAFRIHQESRHRVKPEELKKIRRDQIRAFPQCPARRLLIARHFRDDFILLLG